MATREIRIPHSEIQDTQTITQVNERKFKEAGLDMHVNGVEELHDDNKRGERVLKIHKTTRYFFMGK